jgi:glutaredoxin
VRPVLPCLVGLGLGACVSSRTLPPAEVDRIHRTCSERIAAGGELTPRPRDIGKLPEGLGTGDRVVIYGAAWCDACHAAADYLARVGIPFEEHDIELDAGARAKLERTLALASLPRGRSLPVVEVRGTVMLGFMPCVLEAAWDG